MQRGSASPPVGLLQSLPGPGDNHHHDYDNGDHDFDDDDVDVSLPGPGDRYQRTPTVTIALNSDYHHRHGPYCLRHHCHHYLLHDHDNNHHCHDPQTTPAPTIAPEAGVRGDEAVAGPR